MEKIDAKKAAGIALKYLEDLFPENSGYELEEIDSSEDEKFWFITIGMSDNSSPSLTTLTGKARKYKEVKIDSKSGNVKSVKIRKV
jgi:hypothetical protein